MTDLSDPVQLAQALIRCRSITPAEGGALSVLESALGPAGFRCRRLTMSEPGTPDVENLYARIGTSAPNLCFAGHTDVVPPGKEGTWTYAPFAGVLSDGILYGRGAADMKGGIACFVAAVLGHLQSAGGAPKGSLSFLITGDEEGPSINGTSKVLDWIVAQGETLDACVVGEPSNPTALGDEIKIGRRGSLNGTLIVRGRQGHVAYPHAARNPIPGLLRVLGVMLADRLDDGTEHFAPSNLEITSVDVGNPTTNVIPAEACARFNLRYNDRHDAAGLETRLRSHGAAGLAGTGLAHAFEFERSGDAFLTEPGPLVAAMRQAVADVTGRTPRLTTGGGTSDARFIKAVCPVIEFGLVNATIHQVDEHVAVADLITLTEIYRRFMALYFATASGAALPAAR